MAMNQELPTFEECLADFLSAAHPGYDDPISAADERRGVAAVRSLMLRARPAPAIDVEGVVTALWDDVTDRRGIKHEFNQCDADVKDEIRAAWSKIIRAALGGKEQR